jgi:hypothetical protein
VAERYAVAAGNWSNTATWNGGTLPGSGDDVFANNYAVTIDQDVTVLTLSTRAGTTAVAGGSFTTDATARTINADCYAGTTTCLILSAGVANVLNGDSYGSDSTNTRFGVEVRRDCVQNGDSTGGSGSFRSGTNVLGGGVQNGNSTGGSLSGHGTILALGAIQNGNATAAGNSAYGTLVNSGGVLNGDSFGGTGSGSAAGAFLQAGAIHNGNATGGTVVGTYLNGAAIFYGDATGGTSSGADGVYIPSAANIAIIGTATGNTANAFGVRALSTLNVRHVVIIGTESGSYAKSLVTATETDYTNIPFADPGTPSAAKPVNPFTQTVIA